MRYVITLTICGALVGLSSKDGILIGIFTTLGFFGGLFIYLCERAENKKRGIRNVKKKDIKALPTYSNGKEYEYYVAAYLERYGYKDAITTPTTSDYGADIICTDKDGKKVAVQCKLYNKPVGYRAVEEAIAGMRYYKCDKAMVVTNNTYTKQAYEAAKRMDVTLIERVS